MFKNLKDVELSTRNNYITFGVHKVKITKLESSTKTNPSANTPYLEFHMETGTGAQGKARIYGDRDGQTEKAADYKAKMLKELLVSAGVKDFSDNNKACMQAVGGTVQAVFAQREYWTTDSEGMPVIKSIADYKFSTTVDKDVVFDPSWNKKLSSEDLKAYNDAMQMAGTESSTSIASDSMPF